MSKTICRAALILSLGWALAAPAWTQTKLVVWHAYRGGEKEAFEKVIAQFNAAHAGKVVVESLAVPYDAFADKITAAVPRGKGADVFIYAQDRLGGWVEGGNTIEPIDFFLDDATLARFLPSTLEAMTYQGAIYGLPLNFKVVTLFYNKKLVKTPPKTTGELATIAKSLTKADAGSFGLAYWYSDFYYHSALMNGFGGGVFGEGRKLILDSPGNVKSVELLLKWIYDDKILPAEPSTALITNLFNTGKAAMVFSGPWFLGEIADGVDFGLAPLPAIDEAGGAPMKPWITVEGVYIAQPSAHKDEAFEFVDYLTGLEAARVMALEGGQTPANAAIYEDPEVAKNPVLAAFRAQVEKGVAMPNYAEMSMIWSPATTAMNTSVKKNAPPATAFKNAQEEAAKRIASLRQ